MILMLLWCLVLLWFLVPLGLLWFWVDTWKTAETEIPEVHADPLPIERFFKEPEHNIFKSGVRRDLGFVRVSRQDLWKAIPKTWNVGVDPNRLYHSGWQDKIGFQTPNSQIFSIFTKLATTPEKASLEITNFVATPTDVAFFGITRNISPDHRMEKYFQSLRTWRRHLKRLAWKWLILWASQAM